jgi:2-polyprenyl-3-methyl-5-hydroxy-6-metoxy-1,4-benzoquinol methylase
MNTKAHGVVSSIESKLLSDSFLNKACILTGLSLKTLDSIIRTSLAEAKWGLEILSNYDLSGKRILEVGSGIGILSTCLKLFKHNVVQLEPGAEGFSCYRDLSKIVSEYFEWYENMPIDKPIEALDINNIGKFDFIFSQNVIEHVPSVEKALCTLDNILSDGGMMVHVCPNYAVPYEPHFGIFLFPIRPSLTRLFIGKDIRQNPAWKSINFITWKDVQRVAEKKNRQVKFKKNMMYHSFKRLFNDAEFAKRQKGIPTSVYSLLKKLRLLELIKITPHQLQTPMIFEWYK